jgi:hypothetical protein
VAWRLVQSVHQAAYWGLLILAAAVWAVYRLAQVTGAVDEPAQAPAADSIAQSISYWQTSIQATAAEGLASVTLKRALSRLLVHIYASQYPAASAYDLFEALKSRKIPLPPSIHAFLFPDEASEADKTWKGRLRRLAQAPGRLFRRWTSLDRAEYYRALEETLTYMEELMEINHGDNLKQSHN